MITILTIYLAVGLYKLMVHGHKIDQDAAKELAKIEKDEETLKRLGIENPQEDWANLPQDKRNVKTVAVLSKIVLVFTWPVYD